MDRPKQYGVERREFLKYMTIESAIPLVACHTKLPVVNQPRFTDHHFKLNVASGDPEPDSVVLLLALAIHAVDGPWDNNVIIFSDNQKYSRN